jgi:hypothetical protein
MSTTIAERVAAGTALLDAREPGWWERINVGELRIDSHRNCILGQLYGTFDDGMAHHDLWHLDGKPDVRHGFMWTGGNTDRLAAEWKRVITERRAAA